MDYEGLKQEVQTDNGALYDVLMVIANSPIQDDFYNMLVWHFPCEKHKDCLFCMLYEMW